MATDIQSVPVRFEVSRVGARGSRMRNALAQFRSLLPRMRYRSSWLAGVAVVLFVAWMCSDHSSAACGGHPALKQALQESSGRAACDYVTRRRYGWPWRFVTIEIDHATALTVSPYSFTARELHREVRDIDWARLGLIVLTTTIAATLASRHLDQARKQATTLFGLVRRLSQFRLRTLGLMMTAMAFWLGHVLEKGAQQHRIVTEISTTPYAYVCYGHGENFLGVGDHRPADTLWNRAVSSVVGEYGVDQVYGIGFWSSQATAAQLRTCALLDDVEVIGLGTTPVDSEIVAALQQYKRLWVIAKEQLTAEEKASLQRTLPHCVIWNAPGHGGSRIQWEQRWEQLMKRSRP